MKNWIKVEDRLPEIGTEVNVFCPEKEFNKVTSLCRLKKYEGSSDYYWDNNYGTSNLHLKEAVTHWQPLPEPPTE